MQESQKEIDPEKIRKAGKSLKFIVTILIAAIILTSIIAVMIASSKNLSNYKFYMTILFFVGLISNFIILVNLYDAGNNLDNCLVDIEEETEEVLKGEINDDATTYECIHCGYEDDNDFDYCPSCGKNDNGEIKI